MPPARTSPGGSPRSSSSRSRSTSSPGRTATRSASTSRCGSILALAGAFTLLVGIIIGLPTLRLRGDYLAIVTLGFGEIVPQFVRNADSLGGFDLTNGTFGIAPIDSLRFRLVRLPGAGQQGRPLLLDGDRAAPLHRLLLHPASRLAARPGVDRDSRGRDGGGRDGRPAHADEDLVVRDRRVLRRRGRRVLRELQGGGLPRGLLLQLLDLPALHGHPRRDGQHLGRVRRRHDPRVPQHRGPRHDRVEGAGRGRSTSIPRSTSSASTARSSSR